MKSNKNEELQSRRQFFKNAAKAALPVFGIIVLANTVGFANATTVSGCGGSCQDYCTGHCQTTCNISCKNHCRDDCGATCKYTCHNTCKNNNK